MHSNASVRQWIPIPRQRTRCTNTLQASRWQRLRAATVSIATRVANKIESVVARAIAAVSKAGLALKARMRRIARAVMVRRPWVMTADGAGHAVSRGLAWSRDTWHRVVRPFLKVRVVALGVGSFVVGLAVSPVATLTVVAAGGVVLVGLSRLISVLETSNSRAARVTLSVIETAAQVGRALAYVAAAALVLVLCLASPAFALTEGLELVLRYKNVPNALSISTFVFFILTGNWTLAAVEVAALMFVSTRTRKSNVERQEIPLIRVDANRAWNGDEMVQTHVKVMEANLAHDRTPPCLGCDLDDGGPRFGMGGLSSLCSECFAFLAEDELVNAADDGLVSAEDVLAAIAAGIPVPACVIIASGARLHSQRVSLDLEDVIVRSKARIESQNDLTQIFWAETAWWFDGRGNRRARRWHGFIGGRVAALVVFDHERGSRGFYALSPAGDGAWDRGPFHTLARAQEAAVDEISDLRLFTNVLPQVTPSTSVSARSAS